MDKYKNLVNRNNTNNLVNTTKAHSLQEQPKSNAKRKVGPSPDETCTSLDTDSTHHTSIPKAVPMPNQHSSPYITFAGLIITNVLAHADFHKFTKGALPQKVNTLPIDTSYYNSYPPLTHPLTDPSSKEIPTKIHDYLSVPPA